MTLKVAFDMTPTLGVRTGIGNVVHHMYETIKTSENIELKSYTLSLKAKNFASELPEDNIFVPVPATVLLSAWKKTNLFKLSKHFNEIDVIHATNYLAPPTKKPLLITIHDLTMLKYPELVTPQIKSLATTIKKRLKSGAHVHVPAQAIKDDVLDFLGQYTSPDKVHVVGFALVDLPDGKPSPEIEQLSKGEPFILSIGALEPRKNHARLISAFEKVHGLHPNTRLFIVGPDGPTSEDVKNQIAQLNHSARAKVFVLGKVSHSDRTYLLNNAHVLAYPSIYEGFGLPLLEAMATDTPIVTSSEGSLPEVAQDCAVYVNPFDTNDVARGINEILDDQALRDKLVGAGKERLKEYSWDQTAKRLEEIYKIVSSEK